MCGSPQWSLSLRLPNQNPVHTSPLPHTRHMRYEKYSFTITYSEYKLKANKFLISISVRAISSFRPSLQFLHSDTDEVSRDNLSQVRPKSGIDLLVGFRNSLRIPTWRIMAQGNVACTSGVSAEQFRHPLMYGCRSGVSSKVTFC
jgi:hypothetical protein